MGKMPASWGVEHHVSPRNTDYVSGHYPEVRISVPGVPDRSDPVGSEMRCNMQTMGLDCGVTASLSYEMYVPDDMDWGPAGGKLPGLAGSLIGAGSIPTGGDPVDGPFWSGRLMFSHKGELFGYLYVRAVANQPKGPYGFGLHAPGRPAYLMRGRWNLVTASYTMDEAGKGNGVFRMNLNGREAVNRADIAYRSASDFRLVPNYLLHQFRYGGSGPGVGPSKKTTLRFRRHRITTSHL